MCKPLKDYFDEGIENIYTEWQGVLYVLTRE